MKITRRQLVNIIRESMETRRLSRMFVLVGPPSVGKSTWIRNNFTERQPYIINRDDLVEQVAAQYGWTYDDMFVNPPEDAQIGERDPKYGEVQASPAWMTWTNHVFSDVMEANGKVKQLFDQRVAGAIPSGLDVVVDMTNMNARARSGALKAIEGSEGNYEKIAVDFKFEGAEQVIIQVAQKRAQAAARMGKSKTIPPEAFERMFNAYEQPTLAEGFDSIIEVDNRQMLADLIDRD